MMSSSDFLIWGIGVRAWYAKMSAWSVGLFLGLVAVVVVFLLCISVGILQTSNGVVLPVPSTKSLVWGRPFAGSSPVSRNVEYNCTYNGQPICCGLTTLPAPNSTDVTAGCDIRTRYIQSDYEKRQFEHATDLSRMTNLQARADAYRKLLRYDIDASNVWLDRVRVHMETDEIPEPTEADNYYLSRFQVTKTCGASNQATWLEWIEPITIHMRHPFSFRECDGIYTEDDVRKQLFRSERLGVDYVLIQSGEDIRRATSVQLQSPIRRGRGFKSIGHTASFRGGPVATAGHLREAHVQSQNYFFDAQTSTFQNSLRLFLCSYHQRGLSYHKVYGFEYTLLEPTDFWRRVPPSVRPNYHFYNVPTSANHTEETISPNQMIKDVATPRDFVAYKLDVDAMQVSVPLALELLNDTRLRSLVDEFFFELPFRSQVLAECGWGGGKESVPAEYAGLKLDRLSAMQFFLKLRIAGIRAHVWP